MEEPNQTSASLPSSSSVQNLPTQDPNNNSHAPYTIKIIPQTPEGVKFYLNSYRPFRLKMLQESPKSFSSTYAREISMSTQSWESRVLHRRARTFVAVAHNEDSGDAVILSALTLVRADPLGGEDGGQGASSSSGIPDFGVAVWEMAGMYTLPEARGRGIAAGIVRFAEEWVVERESDSETNALQGKGCALRLAVMEGNQGARGFYERV
ncbi:hypothetical protein QBC44DRAFT_382058, partial [Cladorrhinum sp. PSN332]